MAREPQPWYWQARKAWYVTIAGQRHRLSTDEAEAKRVFHRLMAAEPRRVTDTVTVIDVADQFLGWIEKNRAAKTYRWYRDHWQKFLDHSKIAHQDATELRPRDVSAWLDSQTTWSQSSRHGAITALKGAFNWAVRQRLISENPLVGIEKPPIEAREVVVPSEHYEYMLRHSRQDFCDLITTAWECGARPQEIRGVTASQVDLEKGFWEFRIRDSKGKRRKRVVYLTDSVREICRRRIAAQGEGQVFRNTKGNPWDAKNTSCRFRRFRRHLGRLYCLYHFRHTFATRMALSGMDSLTLAKLMGHSDTSMLARVYAHLDQDPQEMRHRLQAAISLATNR